MKSTTCKSIHRMKYSHSSKHTKSCRHDPDTRAQLGFRLRYARLRLGWSIVEAGKYFQVTERTWHNWETGSHRIPFAVYKLARILSRYELPGKAWAGWRFEADQLITPEGRQITPQDGAWWSLLIRQARCFRSAYDDVNRLRILLDKTTGLSAPGLSTGVARALAGAGGLVPYKTTAQTSLPPSENRHQNDVIMAAWPIHSDSPTPLTPLHAPRPTTSAFPSTPSFASPWTPTCAIRLTLQRPPANLPRPANAHLKQLSANQPHLANPALSSPPSSPEPKSRPATKPKNGSAKPSQAGSAKTAAAKAAKLASAPRGTP